MLTLLALLLLSPALAGDTAEPDDDGPALRHHRTLGGKHELAPGLTLYRLPPPPIPDAGYSEPVAAGLSPGLDPAITVLIIDPARYELVYLSVLDDSVDQRLGATAVDWVEQQGLVAAWNPGMFEPGYKATGYTRTGDFTSQPKVKKHSMYDSFFVAGPRKEGLPAADVLHDADHLDDWDLVAQSLTILRDGRPAYPPRTKQWSELAFGTDDEGHIVVAFSRYPYEMREFGARVAALDLGIQQLVHGEGGPEASLVLRTEEVQLQYMGSYETGFYDDSNGRLWSLPNIMGVRAR